MEFLVAVVGVVLLRNQGTLPGIHRDVWFANWVVRLGQQRWLDSIPFGRLLLAILVPVVGICLVVGLFDGRTFNLWLFLLELLVLLYALGRGNLERLVRAYENDLGREDLQAAFHDAAIFNLNHREGAADDWEQLHQETLAAIPYRYFERFFPVIFWFILLGAPGALFYRLTALYCENQAQDREEEARAEQWLWLVEWLPLRLLGLVFAFVGNFSTVIGRWRTSLYSFGESTPDVLRDYVSGALDLSGSLDDFDDDFSDLGLSEPAQPHSLELREVGAIRHLFERALILWLCLAALWVILF